MNRKGRRAKMKARPSYLRESRDEIIKRLVKNGITVEDLKKEYQKGYDDGFREGTEPVIRSSFAAVCLALHDLHGFGKRELAEILNAVDRHLTESLSSAELIDEVWERMGLRLDFDEPFDRIQEL